MAPGKRTLGRKIAIGVGTAIAALLLLVVLAVALVDSDAVSDRVAALVLPRVSDALGREVTVGDTRLSLFPDARVRLAGLTVAGREGEPALVAAEALDVEVGLWALLRSLGKEIDVRSVVLVEPTVSLVRDRDGRWNYEGLGGEPAASPPAADEGGGGTDLAIRQVRVQDGVLRVIDRTAAGDEAGVALRDIDLQASGLGAGLPFDARLAAAFASDVQNLNADLSVARLPDGLPSRAEEWPPVRGTLRIGALPLDRLGPLMPAALGTIVRGGKASLDAQVSTGERGYRVEGSGDLREVSLRGQPASGRFRAEATVPPARPGATQVKITELVLDGPGVELSGHASVELSPLRASFVVTGPLLDLDAVMGVLPEGQEDAPEAEGQAGPLLPASVRKQVQAARAQGTVAVQTLRAGRMTANDVRARAVLEGGVLTLEQLDAGVFGGRVSAGGSRVALGEARPSWRLAAKLSGLELADALKAFSGSAPLVGALDGTLDVEGVGTDWEKLRDGVTGLARLALEDGALTTADLGGEVLGAVAKGLKAAGRAGAAAEVAGAGGRTALRDLAGEFEVKDGFLAARQPFRFQAPFGAVSLGGRIGLGGRLELDGRARIPQGTLREIAGGGLPLPDALEVPLALGGTLGAPTISVEADDAVAGIARGEARRAAEGAREEAERAGRRAIGDALKGIGGKRR